VHCSTISWLWRFGTYESSTRTDYLADRQNFTGYEQVVNETLRNGVGEITETTEYTFGHDETAQTTNRIRRLGQCHQIRDPSVRA
jgi:hypothetical protein